MRNWKNLLVMSVLILGVSATGFVACGGKTTTGKTHEVTTAAGNKYSPEELTINKGDTVNFTLGATHNLIETDKATFDAKKKDPKSGGFSLELGKKGSKKFDTAGTFWFVCGPHVAVGMRLKITVK